MKVPRTFTSEKNLDKKIEKLLAKKILTYKPKHDDAELVFEVRVFNYGEEFIIEYPVHPAKGDIRRELRVIQPKIGKNGLNDLVVLSESISSYHNKSVSLSASIRDKDGQREGFCTVPLDQPLSIDDFLKTLKTFYKDSMDRVKSIEIKYRQ